MQIGANSDRPLEQSGRRRLEWVDCEHWIPRSEYPLTRFESIRSSRLEISGPQVRSVWAAVVLRRDLTRFRRQRQQADGVEPAKRLAIGEVLRPHGRRQGHRMESASEWTARLGRRHCRPMHPVLEHAHTLANKLHRHRLAGLQSDVLQECQRNRQHARLFFKPDNRLEVSLNAKGRHLNRTHLPSAISLYESRWPKHRHWRRRRDIEILERLPLSQRKMR